jgi:hypothetical protein
MLDNQDVAVLTKVNDLAERRGLKPYDFVATAHHEEDSYVLQFECPAYGNALREERFAKMLSDLGATADGTLKGETSDIIDALDNAIRLSPRNRSSF